MRSILIVFFYETIKLVVSFMVLFFIVFYNFFLDFYRFYNS